MAEANPVLVEIWRGTLLESRHRGAAVIADGSGAVVATLGDGNAVIYPRSAIKPIQALDLVASGAADRYGFDDGALSLACASHNGEGMHVGCAAAMLARAGLSAAALACGPQVPGEAEAAATLIRSGEAPTALHNNCSGKHAGFLAGAAHRGEAIDGYVAGDHPVQRRWIEMLAMLGETDLAAAPRGIDGCGIPVVGIPLSGLATAMARFAGGSGVDPRLAQSAQRLMQAVAARPEMMAGSGRFCSAVNRALAGSGLVKIGAEGVYCAALLASADRPALGVALKIDDGGERAAEVALGAVLARLQVLGETARSALSERLQPPIRNRAGAIVGEMRASSAFAALSLA